MNRKFIGNMGEDAAASYLNNEGFAIIDRNFFSKYGEIDIICRKLNIICFVEVKSRKQNSFMRAVESVSLSKQEKIINTATVWIEKNKTDCFPRFDVIEVYFTKNLDIYNINHIQNAFWIRS